MFSRRFQWDTPPNRLSVALAARRRAGVEVLDLTGSNPTQCGIEYPPEIAAVLADPRALRYDPAPAGMMEAREAVAGYYAARGFRVAPERILLTASTSEAYAYLFKLLADPGDEVLVPRPSYPLFEYLAAMESLAVAHYPLSYHGAWSIDCDALAHAIHARTRAIVLVNPNNPTGSFVKRDELARIATGPLISDEVFSDYAFAPDPTRVTSLAGCDGRLSFSLSGLSKVAGLPQMKLGWIVVNGPERERSAALERLEWIADTFLSVGTPVQCALPRLLSHGETVARRIAARTRENLEFLRGMVAPGSPLTLLGVEGGWCATVQVPRVRSEEEWAVEVLDRHGVLVQPGYFYDFESEAFLVLSLLTDPRVFREGAARLAAFAARQGSTLETP
jgi:aspartate/methionine/tyrosine aminotransferase